MTVNDKFEIRATAEPLLPQILKAFKHLGSEIIPMLRAELNHYDSGSFYSEVSKESSPADQYFIASPGGDDDTSMTSTCSPYFAHGIAASSLQISDSSLRVNSPSGEHYPTSTVHTDSTKHNCSPSNPNSGPSSDFPPAHSSHSEIPPIKVGTYF